MPGSQREKRKELNLQALRCWPGPMQLAGSPMGLDLDSPHPARRGTGVGGDTLSSLSSGMAEVAVFVLA